MDAWVIGIQGLNTTERCASCSGLSAGALRAARGLGSRVPDDLAVIGFDGLQLGTLVEALTIVALDTRELGALAVEQAGRLLARSGPLSHDEAAVKATLRLRESAWWCLPPTGPLARPCPRSFAVPV
ncbi:substrate-binding domain-containing protein [Streptomyces sp. C1-1]|uniref:substrate-binding domain-containing protein n=1 Tax=Streptomyces sp. C1-1 TaxID=3231173 RepID=UPI003CFD360B